MGIIGQTHGVIKAAKPHNNPFRKMLHSDEPPSFCEPNEFNSSVTGVQSSSLSTSTVAVTGADATDESGERFSNGTITAPGVPASPADAATVTVLGKSVDLKKTRWAAEEYSSCRHTPERVHHRLWKSCFYR